MTNTIVWMLQELRNGIGSEYRAAFNLLSYPHHTIPSSTPLCIGKIESSSSPRLCISRLAMPLLLRLAPASHHGGALPPHDLSSTPRQRVVPVSDAPPHRRVPTSLLMPLRQRGARHPPLPEQTRTASSSCSPSPGSLSSGELDALPCIPPASLRGKELRALPCIPLW